LIGLTQGITELFPISSLGHSVLIPALIGGSWKDLATQSSTRDSGLAFIVALHVATAVALLIFYRSEWVRIIRGFLTSLRPSIAARRLVVRDDDERLAWLLVIATIPVGLTGVLLEHTFRTIFAKPLAAAVFLTVNGVVLLVGERLRRHADADSAAEPRPATGSTVLPTPTRYGARPVLSLSYREALGVGRTRSRRYSRGSAARRRHGRRPDPGLSHADAARFSFLLATPVIFAAGVLKLASLAGPAGDIHGQVLVGSLVAGTAAYASVRFLVRYFQTRTLTPFAIYSLLAGIGCVIRFSTVS